MNTAEQFTAALFPDSYRVLGHRMQPFTIGHALLLERMRNPLVTLHRDAGRGDLKLAIAICSRPFPRAEQLVQSRWIAAWLALIWCPFWKLNAGIQQFLAYRTNAERTPEAWTNDTENKSPRVKSPIAYRIRVWMITELGISPREAICTPLAIALHDYCVWAELQGALELYDDEDEEALDEAEQLAKRIHQN